MVAPAGSIDSSRKRATDGLADALREATRALHRRAERSGVIAELLGGRIRPGAYLLFAFNLLPIYRALETALGRHAALATLAEVAWPELARTGALAADVAILAARFPDTPLRILGEGESYRRRIENVAKDRPERLLAHAYVRYLGDLSGGQVLARLLGRTPGIGPEAVRFYAFPALADLARAKLDFRRAIDRAAIRLLDPEGVVEEAREAFRLSIALAEGVARASANVQDGPSLCARV